MRRFALPILLGFVFLSPHFAKAEMSADHKKEIETLVHEYILNNGGLLIESVNKFQTDEEAKANREAESKAAEFLKSIKDDKNLAIAGNPDGDITVVEFYDYNCGYCKKALEEIQSLLKEDKNVKVVLYDMPILGPSSLETAKWGMAAKKQNKFFDYHVALMHHNGEKDEAVYKKLAKDVGLDVEKLLKDKNDPAIDAEIKKYIETAQSLGFSGTPGFIINEKVFRGYIPYDVIQSTIKEQREKLSAKKN